jgi:hypothetical protein
MDGVAARTIHSDRTNMTEKENEEWVIKEDMNVVLVKLNKSKRRHKREAMAKRQSPKDEGSLEEALQAQAQIHDVNTTVEVTVQEENNLLAPKITQELDVLKEMNIVENELILENEPSLLTDAAVAGRISLVDQHQMMSEHKYSMNDLTNQENEVARSQIHSHQHQPFTNHGSTRQTVRPQFTYISLQMYQYYQTICRRLGVDPIDRILHQIESANRMNDTLSYFNLKGKKKTKNQ